MKLLAILFSPSEAEPVAALAHKLGIEVYDAVQFGAHPVGKGPHNLWHCPEAVSPDAAAIAIAPIARDYTHIAAVSSMSSKDLLPRLAGLLDAPMVSEVIAAESAHRFQRPMLAGAVIATVEAPADQPLVLTFRPSGFHPVELFQTEAVHPLELPESRVKVISSSTGGAHRPDLGQAKVVVSGGKPLGDAATFEKLIGGLADQLGGAVGATRAAVDAGIASSELQVGQTGKIVAPELYIAAGISGSTQHLAGIKDSKLIVAINKDPDAPIFEVADLGLVADLFQAIPELQSKLPS